MLYFDHAASTSMDEEALNILCESLRNDFANPASKHRLGTSLSQKIEKSRAEVLTALGLNKYELIYTSSATESNNQVIKSFSSKGSVLYLNSDHPSVTNVVGQDDIGIDDDLNIVDFVSEKTKLVVLTYVNSQSGKILDIKNITTSIKKINANTKILIDASQAVGKISLNLKDIDFDFLTIASHKLGGPRGIACLICKELKTLSPLLHGGDHEMAMRSSTPATSLIISFSYALKKSILDLESNYLRVQELWKLIIDELSLLHSNISFPFKDSNCSPYIITLKFTGISSDIILRHLEMKEIYVSSSTACSSKIKGFNPMFKALGIEERFHKNILRISLGKSTTEDEVRKLIVGFKDVITELKFLIK